MPKTSISSPEPLSFTQLKSGLLSGIIVSLKHKNNPPLYIGKGCRTKINTNLGVSLSSPLKTELRKLDAAISSGADTVMDLSTRDTNETLRAVIKHSSVPVGSVPIYSCARAESPDIFFNAIRDHLKIGASFLTIHSALTKSGLSLSKKRVLGIVSRGGCLISGYMVRTGEENPLYTDFDYILEMFKGTNSAVSIGDALRPGALADSNDAAQLLELKIQRELVKKCLGAKVPVFCEGPGHMPLHTIEANIKLQKKLCYGVPYYVLGPLVTDCGVGYDHITAAMGGAIAAWSGADFLCVVTPAEHMSLPTEQDIRDGTIATKMAAHAGDIAKYGAAEQKSDILMSRARAAMDWKKQSKLSFAKLNLNLKKGAPCTMCGDLCAILQMRKLGK